MDRSKIAFYSWLMKKIITVSFMHGDLILKKIILIKKIKLGVKKKIVNDLTVVYQKIDLDIKLLCVSLKRVSNWNFID